jgi:hypothetical protein
MTPPLPSVPYGFCHCGCGVKTSIAPHDDPRRGYIKGEPYRYIWNHHIKKSLERRFWARVVATDGCWNWRGYVGHKGYGFIASGGKSGKPLMAHRVSYELNIGKILQGMEIDHLCANKRCVNPAHLEAKTPLDHRRSDIARRGHPNSKKTHCPKGHEYTEENTGHRTNGGGGAFRVCRRCAADRTLAYKRKKNAILATRAIS